MCVPKRSLGTREIFVENALSNSRFRYFRFENRLGSKSASVKFAGHLNWLKQ